MCTTVAAAGDCSWRRSFLELGSNVSLLPPGQWWSSELAAFQPYHFQLFLLFAAIHDSSSLLAKAQFLNLRAVTFIQLSSSTSQSCVSDSAFSSSLQFMHFTSLRILQLVESLGRNWENPELSKYTEISKIQHSFRCSDTKIFHSFSTLICSSVLSKPNE